MDCIRNAVSGAGYFLGVLDIAAGVTMIWAFQKITTAAGWGTAIARWATVRRTIYASMSLALIGLGLERLLNNYEATLWEALLQSVVLFGIMTPLILRAFGYITQDAPTAAWEPPKNHRPSH